MMIKITGTAAIRRNFMALHICIVKVPRPWFFGGSFFARGTSHGDSALVSAPGYAQDSIHRWLMAIIFEREEAERKWRHENRGE
jgi:hypothetical protein